MLFFHETIRYSEDFDKCIVYVEYGGDEYENGYKYLSLMPIDRKNKKMIEKYWNVWKNK